MINVFDLIVQVNKMKTNTNIHSKEVNITHTPKTDKLPDLPVNQPHTGAWMNRINFWLDRLCTKNKIKKLKTN